MQSHQHPHQPVQAILSECFGPFKSLPQNPYLTPPHSTLDLELGPKHNGTSSFLQASDYDPSQISISTQFYPGAVLSQELADIPADLVIQSGDAVFFYLHSALLRLKSSNDFGRLLSSSTPRPAPEPISTTASAFLKATVLLTPANSGGSDSSTPPDSPSSSRGSLSSSHAPDTPNSGAQSLPTILTITEGSPLLNLVLHILYGLPFSRYAPDFDTLAQAFPFFTKYGLTIHDLVTPQSEMCASLLNIASQRPLDVYTLAAQYKLHDLAVLASQYTLSVSLSTVTDEQSVTMGPLYLKWLFFLHLGRAEALKRILVQPLEPHPAKQGQCNPEDQMALARAWGLVTATAECLGGDVELDVRDDDGLHPVLQMQGNVAGAGELGRGGLVEGPEYNLSAALGIPLFPFLFLFFFLRHLAHVVLCHTPSRTHPATSFGRATYRKSYTLLRSACNKIDLIIFSCTPRCRAHTHESSYATIHSCFVSHTSFVLYTPLIHFPLLYLLRVSSGDAPSSSHTYTRACWACFSAFSSLPSFRICTRYYYPIFIACPLDSSSSARVVSYPLYSRSIHSTYATVA